MRVLVTAKLSDAKLSTKLVGLQGIKEIEQIALIRSTPLEGSKILNITPPHVVKSVPLFYEIWRTLSVFLWSRRKGIQVIIGIQGIPHGVTAVAGALWSGKPSVLWLIGSDAYIWLRRPVTGAPLRWAIKNATVILSMGRRMTMDIRLRIPRTLRIFETLPHIEAPNALDETRPSVIYDLIYVGNLITLKNVATTIRLVKRLHTDGIKVTFVVVGDGPLKNRLKKQARTLGLSEYIYFTGHVWAPQKLMKKSKLMILLSKSEGLPSVITEAGLSGLPVVATDVGDIRDFFGGDSFVQLVDPRDEESQYRRLKSILTDNDLLRDLEEKTKIFSESYQRQWGMEKQASHWQYIINLALQLTP